MSKICDPTAIFGVKVSIDCGQQLAVFHQNCPL
jgi:hypothetical protein